MGPRFWQSIEIATSHLRGRRVAAAALATSLHLRELDRPREGRRGRPQLLAPGRIRQSRRGAWGARVGLLDHLPARSESAQGKEFVKGSSVVAGLNANADAVVQGLTYTFATPVLGGQAAISVLGAPGNVGAGIDATLTGPRGNAISGSATDNRTTFADVFYQGTLKWNQGVHNEMVYVTGNIPSGTYDSTRLANLSFGFVAVDGGVGYTYLDKSGHEFSAVGGLTYSFMNCDLQYQNGIDFHLDWGASQFVSKNVQIGLVGYYFQQITGDSGPGAKLGDFSGRVLGIGPQIGFLFPVGEGYQGYLNVKAYKDFAAENRPEGYTAWVTLAISPAPPEAPKRPSIHK